jgi:FtsH-binding integral membrane protein
MALAARQDPRTRLYLWAALAALAAAFAGFFRTFLWPSWQGAFHGPAVVYVHGAFVLAWLLLFATQAALVQSRRTPRHRRWGLLAALVAPGVVVSTMALGVFAMHRDLQSGMGELAKSLMLGTFTSPLVFLSLVAAGLAMRRRPDVHKRLMLMATIAILWPAFFRFRHFFPSVPHPEWVFGFLLPQVFLALVVLADRAKSGRVHPVYLWVGLPFVAEAALETWLLDSPGWRVVANWLAGWFL